MPMSKAIDKLSKKEKRSASSVIRMLLEKVLKCK